MKTNTLSPDLIVACVVGDGEAETGPLATAWHSNKFLDPATDGAVLPILHLNGYKIANPTVLARITREELDQLMRGYGWTPYFVEYQENNDAMHQAMAATLDAVVAELQRIHLEARDRGSQTRPRWPMIVINSPKGWTGPKWINGQQIEGTFRAHQVPLHPNTHPGHIPLLEEWLRSYRPEELFDEKGRLKPELSDLAPKGQRRMGANPHSNGGLLLRDLQMPDFRDYAEDVPSPGVPGIGDTHVLGPFLRDVVKLNAEQRDFRIFAPVVRVYLPPDANCLLSVMDHCLRSRHYVNVVIAGKHPSPQWLTMEAAVKHCTEGIGIWEWASHEGAGEPDVVMACCGDVPTLETLAAVSIMREHLPELKIRVVNVVDLMRLQPESEHPHGLSDHVFDALFTQDKPVIFSFHAYPSLIHQLTYRRTNHDNIHVRGYKEEGTITTPFDMTVLNDLDRFHLVMDAINRLPQTRDKGLALKERLKAKLIEHKQYIDKNGQDMPEIRNWEWDNSAEMHDSQVRRAGHSTDGSGTSCLSRDDPDHTSTRRVH